MVGVAKVRFRKHTSDTLYLPSHILKMAQIKQGQSICLQAGKRQRIVQVRSHKGEKDMIGMSADTAKFLAIPKGKTKWLIHENTCKMGLYIGIYTLFFPSPTKPFGELTHLLRDWVLMGREQGNHLYILTPGSIDLSRYCVRAWTYDQRWKKVWCPWPDFIINKIVKCPQNLRSMIVQEEQTFEQAGCSFLTRSLGSKWYIHQILENHEDLKPFLPCTQLIRSTTDIVKILKQYSSIFVKPNYGTQGTRTFYMQKRKYGLDIYYEKNGIPQKIRLKKREALNWLKRTFVGKRQYIGQQAIQRMETNGGEPVDFRWLLQKDHSGFWKVTAKVARIGHINAVTTNVHTGGRVEKAESWLHREALKGMDDLAERVTTYIEEQVGELGEMGIDLAVDQQGKIWFIEANPRPGRKMLRLLDKGVRALSLQRPLEYAEYTTGF